MVCLVLGGVFSFANDKVFIKKGCYEINISDSKFFKFSNRKRICINYNFYIDKYEVSYKEAKKLGCKVDVPYEIIFMKAYNKPIYKISYKDALNCCKKKGGDLPTREEWEVVGVKYLPYFKFDYSSEDILEDILSVEDSTKTGDIYGLFGNVWEMTKAKNNRVYLKGGSFIDKKIYFFNPFIENVVFKKEVQNFNQVGFRCVYRREN